MVDYLGNAYAEIDPLGGQYEGTPVGGGTCGALCPFFFPTPPPPSPPIIPKPRS